nr:28S ribosomal protein S16 [Hymenolepis microstoma]
MNRLILKSQSLFAPVILSRNLRSIPSDRLKKLIAEESENLGGRIVPGRDRSSAWWLPQPRALGKKVVALRPVKPLPQLRISMVREGCTNRPFYTIQVKSSQAHGKDQGLEQLGCWDPFPNREHGEQLVGLNVERILYWIAQGAEPTERVAELLGLAGIFPIHPHSRLVAHRTRIAVKKFLEENQPESTTEAEVKGEKGEEETVDSGSGEEKAEDFTKRADYVWRKKNSGDHWWRHGLV